MFGWFLTVAVAASPGPFPLPSLDGKAATAAAHQKTFTLPMRFEAVRRFYEQQFSGADATGITVVLSGTPGQRRLLISSKRADEAWKKAVVLEGALHTTIQVTPIVRGDVETIEGNARPLVQFIFGRSPDVNRALDAIDEKHVEQLRR